VKGECEENQQPSTEEPPACQPTEEICDSLDNDCDGEVDENEICLSAVASAEEDENRCQLCFSYFSQLFFPNQKAP